MEKQTVYLDIKKLHPHPDNPRKDLGDLTELSGSIRENGILQNLTVVPSQKKNEYYVVIGNRRLAASKLAELKKLPCVISDMDQKTQVATMLIENIQRNDLTIIEQAHGFQMMIDLGENMLTISEKTGFSETTVKKRLFVASLNSEKSKSAYERGATLGDYMKLQQIMDDKNRDKVLEAIGTHNFNQALSTAISEELRAKVAPEMLKVIKEFASPTDKQSWELRGYSYHTSCRYESYDKSGKMDLKIPKKFAPDEYLYRESMHSIEIYKKQEGQTADKKMADLTPDEQKERREKRRKYKELKELTITAHQLRVEFIRSFSRKTATVHEVEALSEFSFAAVCLGDRLEFTNYADVEGLEIENAWDLKFSQKREMAKMPALRMLLASLYSMFRDNAENKYYYGTGETSAEKVGYYKKNEKLDAIYNCLCAFGYEMSDDERMLRDGIHELFADPIGEKPTDSIESTAGVAEVVDAKGNDDYSDSVCRVCGCTDNQACPEGCYWVEKDMCSVCDEKCKACKFMHQDCNECCKDCEDRCDSWMKCSIGQEGYEVAEDDCELCKSAHPDCDECCKECEDRCNGAQECRKGTESSEDPADDSDGSGHEDGEEE